MVVAAGPQSGPTPWCPMVGPCPARRPTRWIGDTPGWTIVDVAGSRMCRRLVAIVACSVLVALAGASVASFSWQGANLPRESIQAAAVRAPLLADLAGASGPVRVRPVDPATLADVPGLAPIELGHHYTYRLSPDGHTLAVISWPNGGSNAGAQLLLIDLSTWTARSTGVDINDSVLGPFYSPDGAALWWAGPGWHDRAHAMPRGY